MKSIANTIQKRYPFIFPSVYKPNLKLPDNKELYGCIQYSRKSGPYEQYNVYYQMDKNKESKL